MKLFFSQMGNIGQAINGSISLANHIRGHQFSISDNTDTWDLNRQAAELFGLKNNISLFCFDNDTSQDRIDAYQMGKIDFGWYDGYSIGVGVLDLIATTRNGRPVTAISYASGTDDNKLDYLPTLLSGRNSGYETTPLTNDYNGYSDVDLISRPSTIRMGYYSKLVNGRPDFIAGTFEEGKTALETYISETIAKSGWYTNFNHWHWWVEDYAENYLSYLKTLVENEDVYSGSYSDIGEYYFVRESVDSITFIDGVVTVNYSKKYPDSPYDKITTPLWVKVDLSNTSSVGKNITTSHGGKIRSKGNGIYYVSIDLDFSNTSVSFSILETYSPSYINLNKPVLNRTGNDIVSDQPVKLTLFSKLKTDPYKLSAVIDERKLTKSTSHNLATTLDTTNRNYYLGFINEAGVSGTLDF